MASALARLATLDERNRLLEEENRWLKAQLFGRSSEKTPLEERNPDQAWLFNEIEALAQFTPDAPETITIPAHDRVRCGRKKLAADIPRVEIVHDLNEAQKVCPADGTTLERIGEETSEQLEVIPAQIRVLKHIRPKYACPCCHSLVRIAPMPPTLFPKSILTPSLAAQITTAKFVDGIPLYRQEPQFERMGIPLGRGTMALWMIRIGGTFIVPLINLLNELLLAESLIHCDETRLQVLKSDKAPTADHWMWVRAAGPPGRRIVLFDYDPSRGGAVPLRLLEGYHGILVTDGYGAYDGVAEALGLTHAGCMAHCPESRFIWCGWSVTAEILGQQVPMTPDNNSEPLRSRRGKPTGPASGTMDAHVREKGPSAPRSARGRRASSAGWWRRSGWSSRCWHGRGNRESQLYRLPLATRRLRSCAAAYGV
jgi:transposase